MTENTMLVVDASVVLALLLNTPESDSIIDLIITHGGYLVAPHLLDVEITQILRRHCDAGHLTLERARQAITDLQELPIVRYAHQPLLEEIWNSCDGLSVNDAIYLALARFLGVPLVTCDEDLARLSEVELIDMKL